MKVRVVKSAAHADIFDIQAKRWYWPFWVEIGYAYDEKTAIAKAERFAFPESALIWSSDATR